jgi:hypothetical protein
MPETPIYSLPFETPQSKPGITLTGDSDGSHPILAESVEAVLASFESRLTAIETTGYRLFTILKYDTPGSVTAFTKASYDGFKAARVRLVGAGGGGGGAAVTSAAQISLGSGGGGGCYAESFLLAAAISNSENVTIGTGGAGGVGVGGSAGTTTSFGALVSGNGGNPGSTNTTSGQNGVAGGTGATTGSGQLIIPGGDGGNARSESIATATESPAGGSSFFNGGGRTSSDTVGGANGFAARNYGGGGSGAMNDVSEVDVRTGGAGSGGLVIVEVFI